MGEFSENKPKEIDISFVEPNLETKTNPNQESLDTETAPKDTIIAEDDNSQEIQAIKEEITDINLESTRNVESIKPIKPKINIEDRQERIDKFQKQYLPKYLQEKKGPLLNFAISMVENSVKFDSLGVENIPEKGPFLVICNHFGGGESEALLKTFKNQDIHLTVGKNRWWDASPVHQWLFKKLGCIPVNESLINLSNEEKEAALKRQPDKYTQKVFRKIIDRENKGEVTVDADLAHQTVAVLSRGDAIGIYPEGLWLHPEGTHNKAELGQGYRGVEIIVKQYKRLIGEELPVIPTAFIEDRLTGKKQLKIGTPLFLKDNNTNLNNTDWCMAHISDMLPEEQRGYYKNVPKNSILKEAI